MSHEKSKLDPNQIWQRAFDDAQNALVTRPSESVGYQIELSADDGDSVEVRSMAEAVVLMQDIEMTTESSSSPLNVLKHNKMMISVSHQGLDAANGKVHIEHSADDSVFHVIETLILSSGSGVALHREPSLDCKSVRIRLEKGLNTQGTVTVKAVIKG